MPLPICWSEATLTEADLEFLRALPEPVHELVDTLACELEAGHDGLHAAEAQASGRRENERNWWLRWGPEDRRPLEIIAPCPVESDDPELADEYGPCGLHVDHPGRHSFDLEDPPHRDPAPEIAAELFDKLMRDTALNAFRP